MNRTEPEQVFELLEATFPGESVTVDETRLPDAESDLVALVEDDEILATSPMADLERQLLFLNSDHFVTGDGAVDEVELPDVLAGIADTRLRLRGYPESDREKLVLIALSRVIERQALEAGAGTLRTSFQHLSRVCDEQGTAAVYERLAATDLDVHLYGVPDDLPPRDLYTVVHAGHTEDLRYSWFVVFDPEDGAVQDPAALVANEVQPRVWEGFWTFDPERVAEIRRHVERTM